MMEFIKAARISILLRPKVLFDEVFLFDNKIAIYAIRVAKASPKLCNASESRARLPEISPPASSAKDIIRFSPVARSKFLVFTSLLFL